MHRLLVALAASVLGAGTALAQPPGREPIRLLNDFSLAPDGKTLVFSFADEIWSAPVTGGAATRLTFHDADEKTPCISPDGRELAFTSTRNGGAQVFVMDLDGGAPRQITWHSEGYQLEEWLPSGDGLLARGSRDHFWRSAQRFIEIARPARHDEGAAAQDRRAEKVWFDDYGAQGSLSPDGTRLLFVREDVDWFRKGYHGSEAGQVWLFDRRDGTFRELLHDDAGCRWPLWRADGKGFYFVGQQDGTFNLYERELDGDASRQLTRYTDDGVLYPTISRDGSTIVFRRQFDLHVLHPLEAGATPQRIELWNAGDPLKPEFMRRTLTSATDCAFTDDGLEIAFVAGGDLFAMDTELKEPVRVTSTPEDENSPLFVRDEKGEANAIVFVSDQGGQCDLWRVERADPACFWWQSHDFLFRRLTQDSAVERSPKLSPDGTRIAYVKGPGDLMTIAPDGKDEKLLLAGWDGPNFDWSPDGQWLAFSRADDDFNSDVWILKADGTQPPFNVSVHPDNDGEPRWSPDGSMLAFTGRHEDQEVDVHYVFLKKADDEQDARDRRLKKALEKMEKERKKKDEPQKNKADEPKNKTDEPKPAGESATAASTAKVDKSPEKDAKKDDAKDGDKKDELPKVVIDFDGLRDRIHTLHIRESTERNLIWLDDRKLAFDATVDAKPGVYSVDFPDELTPKLVAPKGITGARRLKKAKAFGGLSGGQPATFGAKGELTSFAFSANQEMRTAERQRTAFDAAWRAMRDGFYDGALNHRNWDEVRRKYQEAAEQAVDLGQLAQVIQMLLGELNGSHLGFIPGAGGGLGGPPAERLAFTDVTAHLGARFDPTHPGPGWKVKSVILDSPAYEERSRLQPGDVILSVDGTSVDPSLDPTLVLNGPLARDIRLKVKAPAEKGGAVRDVVIRPISYAQARSLLYDEWLAANRKAVEDASGGKLGYVHISSMDWPSFLRFDAELYKIGYGKDGLIVDVRANGGGSTADHLLTALTQPHHAITVPRGGGTGYPQDRVVYASWYKPIVVLCDQNSYSNAEIFAHAIHTLKRGRLVGVPTAGCVISTGAAPVLDVGMVRMPFRGWFLPYDGEDMELNPAVPDFVLWPKPGDLPAGRDEQLAKAIDVLKEDVAAWNARPQPTLRKASDRRR